MKKTILFLFLSITTVLSFAQTTYKIAPDFTAVTLEGDTLVLSELLAVNKHVLLEFFFNELDLCKETSQMLNEAYTGMAEGADDVFVLSINLGNDSSECVQYRDSLGLEYPIVSGIDGLGNEINDSLDIQSYPTIILIGYDTIPYLFDSTLIIDSITSEGDTVYLVDDINDGDTSYQYDYIYRPHTVYENDIWPINSSSDIIEALNGYGITGINNPIAIEDKSFDLFPNPNSGQFSIRSTDLTGNFDYDIVDISGQVLYQSQAFAVKNSKTDIDISWLNKGIYILRLHNGSNNLSKKLIIH